MAVGLQLPLVEDERPPLRLLALAFTFFGFGGLGADTANFDSVTVGAMPPGWTWAETHRGAAPRWEVQRDPTAPSRPNVFAQLSTDPNRYRFAMALYDRLYCLDGEVSVHFKLVAGKMDQTVGLVWRYQDPNNYYLAHASADDDNVSLYKIEKGKSHPLETNLKVSTIPHKVDKHQWNILKVVFRGSHFVVFFDHRRLLEGEDTTFQRAGRTGLWTKGDTIAYFDNFRVDRKD